MNNLEIYDRFAEVPASAKKEITAGRLKGMTDINPMWRIKCLTEAFGPCGIGWVAPITDKRIEEGANGEKVAVVDIELRYKQDGEWSEPVTGTGGSMLVANETKGLRTSDEAFKMAYTDAVSVACKMLGFGANVYWSNGRTKYTATTDSKVVKEDQNGMVIWKAWQAKFGKDATGLSELLQRFGYNSLTNIRAEDIDRIVGAINEATN